MSRRDTIIVAALINAGLLIILFVSALKNPSASETIAQAPEVYSQPMAEAVVKAEPKVLGDEVDQVLSQYSKQNPLQPSPVAVLPEVPALEPVHPAVEPVAAAPAQNFVDDLNALTKASEQATEVAAAPASEVSAPAFVEVRVKKGDVLEKIARSHHTTVQEIMKINKLSSTSLKIGQVLRVPGKTAVAKAPLPKAQAQQTSSDSSLKYYTVKSGDNPWTIAVKNHIKVEDLLRLNNMDEAKARKLKPGDQIRIR